MKISAVQLEEIEYFLLIGCSFQRCLLPLTAIVHLDLAVFWDIDPLLALKGQIITFTKNGLPQN